MSAQQIQQILQSLGQSTQGQAGQDQIAAIQKNPQLLNAYTVGATYTPGPSYQPSGGLPPGGSSSGGTPLAQFATLVQALGGGGGGSGQQQPATTPVSQLPQNLASNLGAAALNSPAIYNPTPNEGGNLSKGGVYTGAQAPTVTSTVPTVPQGPWSTTPGIFNQATAMAPSVSGPNITPRPPVAGGAAPTPFATAPAAPGAAAAPGGAPAMPGMGGGMGAGAPAAPSAGIDPASHTAALANTGMAMYSHFGGDPQTASHADILNFHNQLSGMIGAATGAGGAPGAGAPGGGMPGPIKRQAGGWVPGRGNTDTVPALLTPGEYVLTKQQAAGMGLSSNTPHRVGSGPIHMDTGGTVPDDKEPRESVHQRLGAPGQTSSSGAPQPSSSSTQPSSSSSASAPGSQTGGQQSPQNMLANLFLRGGTPGTPSAGGGYATQGGYIGGSPGVGQSGYMYPNQAAATAVGDVGAGPGGAAGGGLTQGQATGIGDLASGLTQAAQTYANSIKNWQVQPSAIPNPPPAPSAPSLSSWGGT